MAEGLDTCVDGPTTSIYMEITLLSMQGTYHYTISSFSAITLTLKLTRIRESEEGTMYNVVINQSADCPDLGSINLPTQANILKACSVDVSAINQYHAYNYIKLILRAYFGSLLNFQINRTACIIFAGTRIPERIRRCNERVEYLP